MSYFRAKQYGYHIEYSGFQSEIDKLLVNIIWMFLLRLAETMGYMI